MKPSIDLADPAIKALSDLAQQRAETAYATAEKLEAAVRPIFLYLGENKYPKQIGSCVMLRIEEHFFALSASHVFDEIEANAVLVACGDKVHPLVGERYSSLRGPSGSHRDDPIDASVLHISAPIPEDFNSACLTLSNLDLGQDKVTGDFHVAVGYRTAKSGRKGTANTCKLDKYPTIEHNQDVYAAISLNHKHSVSIAFEDQVLVGDRWLTSPSPRGMSGGAIFRIEGIPGDTEKALDPKPAAKLTAITTELRKKSLAAPPALLGTRIGFHLGLIEKYNPGLVLRNAP